jgi:dedicator of cytokinesis protein 3
MRQRGTRLSFLGGRKAAPSEPAEQDQTMAGLGIENNYGLSKEKKRRSTLRSNSQEDNYSVHGSDSSNLRARQESFDKGRASTDRSSDKDSGGGSGGIVKRAGSVRRRLSMLTMTKKSSKGSGLMGSLNEE